MENFQSQKVQIVSIAVAVAAIGAATAYYLYSTKKPKGTIFFSFFFAFIISFINIKERNYFDSNFD